MKNTEVQNPQHKLHPSFTFNFLKHLLTCMCLHDNSYCFCITYVMERYTEKLFMKKMADLHTYVVAVSLYITLELCSFREKMAWKFYCIFCTIATDIYLSLDTKMPLSAWPQPLYGLIIILNLYIKWKFSTWKFEFSTFCSLSKCFYNQSINQNFICVTRNSCPATSGLWVTWKSEGVR